LQDIFYQKIVRKEWDERLKIWAEILGIIEKTIVKK
jgi:hypothetical protein